MDRPEDARPGDRHGGARPRPGRPRLRADRQARGAGDRARTRGCGGGERRSRGGRCAHRAGLWRPRLRRGVAEEVGVAPSRLWGRGAAVGWAKRSVPTVGISGGHASLCPPYVLVEYAMASVATLPKSGAAGAQVPADAGILVVDDIVKQFDTPEGPLIAVDRVSLSVRPGEFLAVIGPSGCGKSTLFNIIGGLLDGYEGAVRVAGERLRGPHSSIGMIFQEESTFPWRNVLDNVAFPLEIAGLPRAERYDRARHFVKLVGLDGFERRYPAELSGGMRQRVSMARTLAAQPKILLMDEPFASLDEQTRLLLGDKVLQIQQQLKQTTLLITHNITEAVQMSDRILVMTYRPGKMKRIVDIDLPRPRTSEIVGSEAFGRYVAQIWSDLREEATRGMRDDEKHALEHHTGTSS